MALTQEEYNQAQKDVTLYNQRREGYQSEVLKYQEELAAFGDSQRGGPSANPYYSDPANLAYVQKKFDEASANLNSANEALMDAQSRVEQWSTQTTVPSASASRSLKQNENAEIVGDTSTQPGMQKFDDGSTLQTFEDGSVLATGSDGSLSSLDSDGKRFIPNVPAGAEPIKARSATVNIKDARGTSAKKDLRVKIKVPGDYLRMTTRGLKGELYDLDGIIFPYTPSISYEHKADYAPSNTVHSNFGLYFYQRSSITPISISGKFTVQNEKDAGVYLATVHLLRALTKMRSGGTRSGDSDSGAPPPVCRLNAYGDYMLSNVPVAISSFRLELPDSVDYFTIGKNSETIYGQTSVPTVSTISITCIPMYSRDEMQKFSVTGWLGNLRKSGYL